MVEGQGRNGMVVRGAAAPASGWPPVRAPTRCSPRRSRRCLELGLAAEEIASLAYQHSLHAKRTEVRVDVHRVQRRARRVICRRTRQRARHAASSRWCSTATSSADECEDADLVVTTFYHLTEVRRLLRDLADEPPELLAIVMAPHLKTLVRLSQIPAGHRVGIFYSTAHQADGIRKWVNDAGVEQVDVISGPDDPALEQCDLVIVPSENPELGQQLDGKTPLLEFGNVLDAGSIQIVSDALDDMRERRRESISGAAT